MSDLPARLVTALQDRYRIERELGQGGMATVYLAADLKHDRQVALKVMRPELAAVIGAERFVGEIRTTANLQHPHILPLFDSGEADGFVFYVMPYVEGETVRERLRREKQLPVNDAVRIASEVAAALDYAHRQGVIHRDIKPENILLHDGSALVADFGIALAAAKAGDSRMTETGMSLGTPHYMSPEQAMGERELSARSDVYALGCVLYEMLLGEPPFTGPTAQSIVAKVMTEKPARLTTRRERIPPEVEVAVLTALEKLPADRYATASELALALRTPGAAAARQAPPSRAAARVDWRVAAALGVLIGAGLATVLLPRSGPAAEAGAAGGRTQLTFNGRSMRPAISPDGEYVAYVDRVCPRGLFNPCTASLLVQGKGSDRPVEVLEGVPELSAPRFSRDGLTLLVAAQMDSVRSGVFAVPRLGGVPRRIGPFGAFDTHPGADSAVVVTAGQAGAPPVARFIDVASGTEVGSFVLPKGAVQGVAWSPDGSLLAVIEDYTKLTIVRRDGEVTDSIRGPFRYTVRWTPDGKGILLFRALPVKEDDLIYYAVGPDGRTQGGPEVRLPVTATLLRGEFDVAARTGQMVLASGSATWDLWTFELDPAAGPPRQRTSGTTWYGIPAISPDGSRLFYMRGDAIGDNLYMLTLPDDEEALTAEPYPGMQAARVSKGGARLVFGHATPSGGRLGFLELASRQNAYADGNDLAEATFAGDSVVAMAMDGSGLWIVGAGGARRKVLALPDSLRVLGFDADPSGDSVAVLVISAVGLHIATTPLGRWEPRWLYDVPGDEATRYLRWSSGGRIYFSVWKPGDDAPSLWDISSAGGVPVRRSVFPASCWMSEIDIATAFPRGTCRGEDTRSDVWLVSLPGGDR